MEIDIDKWQIFLAIERSQKIPHWAIKAYANTSNGKLTYEEVEEIIGHYSKYEKQFNQ